ncbi:Golgi apparatus protein 1-like [Mya arenaria]|uniref:Golgi apparatus protein 1-like n=1 Tax=Mya arenaria TaxID=6604 RepID=UPI0022E5CB0C|nr:Golgi apparatus protein 1-like [Mya arenaria]
MAAIVRRVQMVGRINVFLSVTFFLTLTSSVLSRNLDQNEQSKLGVGLGADQGVPLHQGQGNLVPNAGAFNVPSNSLGGQGIGNKHQVNAGLAQLKAGLDKAGQMHQMGAGQQIRQDGQGIRQDARKNVMLSTHPDCEEDILQHCDTKNMRMNNFAVLDCLQDAEVQIRVSDRCQHLVWEYKLNLTKDDRFESGANEVCKKAFEDNPECHAESAGKGTRIPCLIEVMDNITDQGCHRFLTKMASIVFGDFNLVYHFMDHCGADIKSHGCGRIDTDSDKMHAQGKTILCLARQIAVLQEPCKKQVLRVAELQADDYHMDRSLYYACRGARELLCEDTHAGNGKVFQCLYEKKMDPKMPTKCRDLLTVRQQLIAEDVKVEKSFFEACKRDIHQNQCIVDMNTLDGHAQRSSVLLCLEHALKSGHRPAAECLTEMTMLRKTLLEDYQITPEIVANCDQEIELFCKAKEGLDAQGGTLHCLMEHANTRERQRQNLRDGRKGLEAPQFRPACKAAIEDLLKEADVGEDVKVDGALMAACRAVITGECRSAKSEEMMDCLMEKIDSDDMTDACERRLLEIQYFVVRDFRLDPELFRQCHKDAVQLCHYEEDWAHQRGPSADPDPNVLPCLYRHLPHKLKELKDQMEDEYEDQKDNGVENGKKMETLDIQPLSRGCEHEVRRAMRRRAKSIDLEPKLESACLIELGEMCSDLKKYDKGEELECLQDNYDELEGECKEEVGKLIQDEDEDLDLDTILMKACTPMIKQFCGEGLDKNAEASEIMDCLIKSKNNADMNEKCRIGIEHHQIVQMKDYNFSHKFRDACKKDVLSHCKESKTKADVVVCLSELVRNDILQESAARISQKCRQEVRADLLEMSEDINLDPKLKKSCEKDIENYCTGIKGGNAKVTECLRDHKRKLSDGCHKMLFKREIDEAVQGADFKLFQQCKSMIKKYCSHKEPSDVLRCLRNHVEEVGFDSSCKQIVERRAMESTKDYRINPSLAKSCKMDIRKFCSDVIKENSNDKEMEGKVINCLRRKYTTGELTKACVAEIRPLIKEVHQDINMDPVLLEACQKQIQSFCSDALGDHDKNTEVLRFQPKDEESKVKTCLEEKLTEGKIDKQSDCAHQIAQWQNEVNIDIHTDPELNIACTPTLTRWCREYESGQGMKMSCLLQVLEDYPDKMDLKCRNLLEKRRTLWEFAAQIAPIETIEDLHGQIMQSPARNYIYGVLMTIIGVIFIVGITCGRVTKRVTAAQKNK